MKTAGSANARSRLPAERAWLERLAIAAVAALLTFRIFLGVDLSDEAYYTSFVDGWLKSGISASVALSMHQTAALLVYPFAVAFAGLTGSQDGLALFLRFLYLGASAVTAIVFYRLSMRFRGGTVSLFSALLVTSYIPFSLHAPSYNTLGMFAMICALSTGALFVLKPAPAHAPPLFPDGGWPAAQAICSAAAWTIAAVAYPTMLAVQLAFIAGLALSRHAVMRNALRVYLPCCALSHAIGLAAMLAIFGMDRLLAMLEFSNASLQVSSGFGDRLQRLVTPLVAAPWFGILCLAMLFLGITAPRATTLARQCAIAIALFAAFVVAQGKGPVLYATTHDLVLMIGFLGVGLACAGPQAHADDALLGDDMRSASATLLRLLLLLGLFAGLVTAVTATNGLINFAVGGFFLAALAMAVVLPPSSVSRSWPHALLLAASAVLLIGNAYAFIYGEPRNPLLNEPRRISEGIFQNLLTSRRQADAIVETSRFLAGPDAPVDTITVFGRLPGIFLLTRSKPMTLSTWDFGQHNRPLPAIDRIRHNFYDNPQHRPDAVLVVADPWTKPPSHVDAKLLQHYTRCRGLELELWTLTLYVRPGAERCEVSEGFR